MPAMLAAKLLRKPYAVKFSGDLYVEFQLHKGRSVDYALHSNTIIKHMFNFVQKLICNNASVAIATSQNVKEYLESIGVKREKIALIPNGVPEQKIYLSVAKRIRLKYGRNAVCSSCRTVRAKGIETIIAAAKLLPQYNFVIFGDGKDKEYYAEMAKRENVSNFYIHGSVEHDKVQSYIKGCKAFVLASYYEPFGIAALDAMAANVPVIVSDSVGMRDILKTNIGLIFKTGSSQDLAAKLSQIGKIDLAAQKREIKQYYWSKIVDSYIEFYKKWL
jgi:1,4-alpha-glucan branching enzyme